MYILLSGINHKTAPIEIREKFALSQGDLEKAYLELKSFESLASSVILTTCNRTEIYTTTKDLTAAKSEHMSILSNFSNMPAEEISLYTYQMNCYSAISHLFQVVSGLDSMIQGESQILGQVKDAYRLAVESEASDSVLNSLFHKAIFLGKKVRTETDIDKYPLSVSHAAVNLAKKILGSLEDKSILIVGAGEVAELSTKILVDHGVKSVIVSNRSFPKAVEMANSLGGRAVKFDEIANELLHTDIVISCTAANHCVIRQDNCELALSQRKGKNIIMIDIAVPRDIEASLGEIDGVHIYDIDDLQSVVEQNSIQKRKAFKEAEQIIAEELESFYAWLESLYVVPVISALKSRGEEIKQNELNKAFNRLGDLTDREKKVIMTLSTSIINQLLHQPIVNLKSMATSKNGHVYAEMMKVLFELDVDGGKDNAKHCNRN